MSGGVNCVSVVNSCCCAFSLCVTSASHDNEGATLVLLLTGNRWFVDNHCEGVLCGGVLLFLDAV